MEQDLLELLISAYKEGFDGEVESDTLALFEQNGLDYKKSLEAFLDLATISTSIGLSDDFDKLVEGTLEDERAYDTLRLTFNSIYPEGSQIFPEMLSLAIAQPKDLGLGVLNDTNASSSSLSNIAIEEDKILETEKIDLSLEEDNKESALSKNDTKADLSEYIYALVQALANKTSYSDIERIFKSYITESGGNYEETLEIAESIYKECESTIFSDTRLARSDAEVREYVINAYRNMDKQDEEDYAPEISEKEEKEEVSTYLLTDGDIENLASTGRVLPNGENELREVTTAQLFDETYKPSKGGIFSEELFGPLHGQSCSCGYCRSDNTEDALAGAVCPECGSKILSAKDRNTTYAIFKSPIPLLMGRNAIIAAMLNAFEKNINEMEKGSTKICYTRFKNKSGSFELFKMEDLKNMKNQDDYHRYFGPEGIEEALKDLDGRDGFIKVNGELKKLPLAIANAYKNAARELGKLQELRYPRLFADIEAQKEMGEVGKAGLITKQERQYAKAVNIYRAVVSLIHTRNGRPQDVLTHYLLITPPGSRPLNDINGISDFGEKNKAYSTLIRKLSQLKEIKEVGEYNPRQEMALMEEISQSYATYDSLMRKEINDKTGLYVGRLAVTKSSEAIRGVITSCDQKEGQEWLRANGIGDIPTKHIIGLPRHAARNMYKREIRADLKKMGYSSDEIKEAFSLSSGTFDDGKDNIIDEALDRVIINGGRGQIVKYERQPTIALGGLQAGYVYLTDKKDSIFIHPFSASPMAGDFDGDTILVTKVMGARARAEAKKMMNRNLTLDSTGELLINLKQESLMGLHAFTRAPEEYKFDSDILIADTTKIRENGFLTGNRLNANIAIPFYHIVEDVTDYKLTRSVDETIAPGSVYATKDDGTKLIAEECLKIKEQGGKLYAVKDTLDSFIAPINSFLTDNPIVKKGSLVCKVPLLMGTSDMIEKYYREHKIAFNQPVMKQVVDNNGEVSYEKTTAGRVIVERKLPRGYSVPEEGFTKKNLEAMVQDIIHNHKNYDIAKLLCDDLAYIGFEANTEIGASLMYQDFPTIKPIDNFLLYNDENENDENVKAERLELYNKLKKEQLGKIEESIASYHGTFIKNAVESGAMKLKDIAGVVDSERSNDYLGNAFGLATSSLALGSVGLSGALNSAQADFTGNKTTDVAATGWHRNRMAAAMDGMVIEKGDCGSAGETVLLGKLDEKQQELLTDSAIAESIVTPEGEKLAEKGEYFTPSLIKKAKEEGVTSVKMRSALSCNCKGICEACLGKAFKEGNLEIGENFGQNAVASLVAPITQMGLDIGKISGKIEKGSDKLLTLLTGASINKTTTPFTSLPILAKNFATKIHDVVPELPYIYCSMLSKVFCFGVKDDSPLPIPLYDIPSSERANYRGLVIADPTQFQNTALSFLSADRNLLRLAINPPNRSSAPKVKKDTIYERENKKSKGIKNDNSRY